MDLREQADLVLAFARVLFVNGQSTDETISAAERLGEKLGVRTTIAARWDEMVVEAAAGDERVLAVAVARPTDVNMHRVAEAMAFAVLSPPPGRPSRSVQDIARAAAAMPP